jgi:4-carboxymuconolactone decarboxylase
MAEKTLYEKGDETRRAVLGNDYVNAALAKAKDDPFRKPLQDYLVECCWGTVWTRPGLPRKIRSMINLAMLTALDKPEELKAHVRGALNNGCTREEIAEVLLQATVYCGAPAGVNAFRHAAEVLDQIDRKG